MADDAPADVCAQVQAQLPSLATGDVGPGDEAALEAHLAACPRCRAELDAVVAVVAGVADLAPPVEPGSELVDRLLAERPGAGAAGPGTTPGPVTDAPAPAPTSGAPAGVAVGGGGEVVALPATVAVPRPGRRRWVVAAAAVLALLLGLAGGLLVGRTADDGRLTALDRAGIDDVQTAVLQGTGGPSGTVVVTGGADPLLVMTLDHVAPGVRYGCALRMPDGSVVPVGSWRPADAGERSWAVPLPEGTAGATAVVVTGPDGRPLAEGALA